MSGSTELAEVSSFRLSRDFCGLAVLAGELRKFVGLFVQIVGEPLLFVGTEFAAKLFTFGLEFAGALNHNLILAHITLFHRLISRFEVIDVGVITL
jgi:hypothetical protein